MHRFLRLGASSAAWGLIDESASRGGRSTERTGGNNPTVRTADLRNLALFADASKPPVASLIESCSTITKMGVGAIIGLSGGKVI